MFYKVGGRWGDDAPRPIAFAHRLSEVHRADPAHYPAGGDPFEALQESMHKQARDPCAGE